MPTLGGFLQAHLTSNVNHRKTRVILRFCVTECLRNITSKHNLPTDCVIGDSPEVKHSIDILAGHINHTAYKNGGYACHELVQAYLDRIEAINIKECLYLW
jgi:hypothetical protein